MLEQDTIRCQSPVQWCPAIETPFGLLELTEIDVFGEDAGSWSLVDALVKTGERNKVEDDFRSG